MLVRLETRTHLYRDLARIVTGGQLLRRLFCWCGGELFTLALAGSLPAGVTNDGSLANLVIAPC